MGDNGDPPNPDNWTRAGNYDVNSIQGNQLRLGATGVESSVATLNHAISGNFEILVDFNIVDPPDAFEWYCMLRIHIDGGNLMQMSRAYASWLSGHAFFCDGQDTGAYGTSIATAVGSGKLRVSRTGSVWTGSYHTGSWNDLHVQDISSADIVVSIRSTWVGSNPGTHAVDFDNFTINSGIILT
jgi:hypothetical protein